MKQPLDLSAALDTSDKKRNPPPPASKTRAPKKAIQKIEATQTGRTGKTQIAGWFQTEISRTLRLIALEQSTTVQALLEEGLQGIFKRYGKDWPEDK